MVKEKINKYGQGHLLSFYEELNQVEKDSLLNQLSEIDFKEIEIASQKLSNPCNKSKHKITPIESESVQNLTDSEIRMYKEQGFKLLKEKKVAVVLLAGGQGTRLGHDGPKGTISIDSSSQLSLFALQAERLRKLEEQTNTIIPWYIMTSPINDKETKKFFSKNNYFNCNPNQIFFFQQGLIPSLTPQGKIILESKSKIFMAPNGNGGVFASMKSSGVLKELKMKGIQWFFSIILIMLSFKLQIPCLLGSRIKKGLRYQVNPLKRENQMKK